MSLRRLLSRALVYSATSTSEVWFRTSVVQCFRDGRGYHSVEDEVIENLTKTSNEVPWSAAVSFSCVEIRLEGTSFGHLHPWHEKKLT